MTLRSVVTSYEEGVKSLHLFEFPVRIHIVGSDKEPEEYRSQTMAEIALDMIYDDVLIYDGDIVRVDPEKEPITVEISGEPKTMAEHIRSNGSNGS